MDAKVAESLVRLKEKIKEIEEYANMSWCAVKKHGMPDAMEEAVQELNTIGQTCGVYISTERYIR